MSYYYKKNPEAAAKTLRREKSRAKTAAKELCYIAKFPDILERIEECSSAVQIENVLTMCRREIDE